MDCLVLSIKVLVFILAEIGKHRPVVHVMAVDHAVVGQRNVAVFLYIGHAVIAVLVLGMLLPLVVKFRRRYLEE